MLNVAVSRAKDSFIVFGDPNVFGVDSSGSPSGLLRNRLELKLLYLQGAHFKALQGGQLEKLNTSRGLAPH
ncbi:hypothetical protein BMETH_1041_0 [methanotrophic bacterial endosymbiont of Bathymodiolus sp.]|nr:hypothetical protein BMETH_1041_0 [methanotrophic bacterial endosymbiont of Bathymodiolus sp.]